MEKQGVYHGLVTMQVSKTLKCVSAVFRAVSTSVLGHVPLRQSFQQLEDQEISDSELSAAEKSQRIKSFPQSSQHRRRSTRGSSFAVSEGTKEEKDIFECDQDNIGEVSSDSMTSSLLIRFDLEPSTFRIRMINPLLGL